ncbi:MAG: MFS transporter [Bacteroidales bacterium]|nr:MFS transporter [Bacteroidales bacterium]
MDSVSVNKKYGYWHWRTLIVLMIGYALFYFVRKNFSIAMPALESELGFSKTQLGIFLTLNGVIYGVSRLVNGFLSDKIRNKKGLMALGLLLSAGVNIAIGFIPSVNSFFTVLDAEGKATMGFIYIMGSLWLINGWLQGMGYPPCSSLMAHWIKPSELATKQSIWNASHSLGAGALGFLIAFILGHFTNAAWQWCFWVPAILAVMGSAMIFFGIKNTPQEVGLPSVHELDKQNVQDSSKTKISMSAEAEELVSKRCLKEMVLANPIIWLISIADFFVYIIRFTILDWGSTILVQFKGMDTARAASTIGAMEIVGGILGCIAAGWITDHFFKGRAQRTSAVFTLLATVSLALFWVAPKNDVFSIALIVLSAFFIYGPQALLGIACSNQATKYGAASANGICGVFAYLAPIVSGVVFGAITQSTGDWNMVFLLSIAMGVVGTVVLGLLWFKPGDGYAKVDKIIAEVKSELGEE